MSASATGQLSPRAQEIAAAARELLEQEGPDGLSMRKVAGRLGIQAPSLYKHLPDKQALESAVISMGFEEQAGVFDAVPGRGRPAPCDDHRLPPLRPCPPPPLPADDRAPAAP